MKLIEDVLKEVRPSAREQREAVVIVREFVGKLRRGISRSKVRASVVVGGSFAKETALRKEVVEVDLFVRFARAGDEEISEVLGKVLRSLGMRVERLHGSRDYFCVNFKNIRFEIVPVLAVRNSGEAVNITDVSPLHTEFVKDAIRKNSKLADEILLAKAFCSAQECYGAESYLKGFSGYALELLISYFGSFRKLVREGAKWGVKKKVVVDIGKHFRNEGEVLSKLNLAKLKSPLVLIDPVQADRNAAAALSLEVFEKFVTVCKKFVKKPSLEFFVGKDLRKVEKGLESFALRRNARVLLMKVVGKGKGDVVGAKMLKLFKFLLRALKKEGFELLKTDWKFDSVLKEARFYFVVKGCLGKWKIVSGPPVSLSRNSVEFRRKWGRGKVIVRKGRLVAKVERDFRNAEDFLKAILENLPKEMIRRVEGVEFYEKV